MREIPGGFPGGLPLSQREDNGPLDALCVFLCRADTLYVEALSVCSLPFFTLFPHVWNQVLNYYFLLPINRGKNHLVETNPASFTCLQPITHDLFLPETYGVGFLLVYLS